MRITKLKGAEYVLRSVAEGMEDYYMGAGEAPGVWRGRWAAELGLALRWGYGSAFGIWHGVLKRYLPEPWAAAAFGATLMTATFSLFPILGKTPPPWRWPAAVLATSIGTHVAYVATVAIVDDAMRRSVDRSPS